MHAVIVTLEKVGNEEGSEEGKHTEEAMLDDSIEKVIGREEQRCETCERERVSERAMEAQLMQQLVRETACLRSKVYVSGTGSNVFD